MKLTSTIAGLGAAVAVIGTATAVVLSAPPDDSIRLLVAAPTGERRWIEPRLTGGFRWAPLVKTRVDATSRAALLSAAAEIFRRGERDASSSHRHATALARILNGDARAAATTLERLTAQPDASVLNDLAAAHYVVAVDEDDPTGLQRALVAVDSALRLDPTLSEARFNRALIIEAFGLRDLARDAWQDYLRFDSGSGWSIEALAHVHALAPEEEFEVVIAREYETLAMDPAAARAFARRYPQRTRTWGEAELLGNWAAAMRENRAHAASKHLRLASELAAELARNGGDRTLLALVDAIEGSDGARRAALAEAHLHFRDGVRAYRDRRPKDAQPLLIRAAEQFARGGSAARTRADYFIAGTVYLLGNAAECGRRMQELLQSVPPGFSGHRAEILSVLASVAVSRARWGDCIEAWRESLSIYERLGEVNNAAVVRQQLVFTYDRLGDRTRAWTQRMLALRELGRQPSTRQYEAVVSMTRAAIMDEDWPAARSFVQLEVDIARRIHVPVLQAESLLYEAEIRALLDERDVAATNLADARARIARVPDPSFRATIEVRANVVEASLTTDAREGVRLLTAAIAFHSTKGRAMYLPDLYLRRGRAWLNAGANVQAAADFEAGVAELERHRESVSLGETRWGVFHAARELFGEAIALALARDDPRTAFDYSERARARALFDTLGVPWRPVRAADVPPRTSILEYAIHGDTMFIFVLDDRGVRAFRRPVNRTTLAADVAAFTKAGAAADVERFETYARRLYAQLVAPVEAELPSSHAIAVVPDPLLGNLPFAALLDSAGRYLVETRAVTTEPSAAFLAAATKSAAVANPQVLIVSGGEELGPLGAAARETRAVAAVYPRHKLLEGDRATPQVFLQEARQAALIHFAGHSVASTGRGDGYLALVGKNHDEGHLDLNEISSAAFPLTSLVVLAACDTAGGEIRSGEGTISVARAFLAAGVPTVVATLWPIDDEESAQFFPLLHRRLGDGMPAKEALRAAQIEWIQRAGSSRLWAAVQTIGQ